MSTLIAGRYHPVLKAVYERLQITGKTAKIALTACMQKLLTIRNAIVGSVWSKMALTRVIGRDGRAAGMYSNARVEASGSDPAHMGQGQRKKGETGGGRYQPPPAHWLEGGLFAPTWLLGAWRRSWSISAAIG